MRGDVINRLCSSGEVFVVVVLGRDDRRPYRRADLGSSERDGVGIADFEVEEVEGSAARVVKDEKAGSEVDDVVVVAEVDVGMVSKIG